MNIPAGRPYLKGKSLSSDHIVGDMKRFMLDNNTGYFAVTIQGKHGMEEGLLIIENGSAIGAYYEYLKVKKGYKAGKGLERVLNAFFAENGVYDCYELSMQQIELLKIFNEDMLFLEPLSSPSLEGRIPVSFSPEFEEQAMASEEESREQLMKKAGLTRVDIDNYQKVHEQITRPSEETESPERVNRSLESQQTGRRIEEEPEEAPVVEEEGISKKMTIPKPPPPESEDLEDLDEKAEQLLKGIKKEGGEE